MRVYKLFKQRKDGTLGPLFINARLRVELGQWHKAHCHPTKGFAVREGWHATLSPNAPHLKSGAGSGRVWVECEAGECELYDRPESQGGTWVLAGWLKPVRIMSEHEILGFFLASMGGVEL